LLPKSSTKNIFDDHRDEQRIFQDLIGTCFSASAMLLADHLLFIILLILLIFTTTTTTMTLSSKTIAVVGGGQVGTTLASVLMQSSEEIGAVVIAARNPDKTKAKLTESPNSNVQDLKVEPLADAVKAADILILATVSAHSDKAIQEVAESLGDVSGKSIIDSTNPLSEFPDGLEVRWEQGTSGGEVLQKYLPNAKVYKAFNTIGVEHMAHAAGKDMMYCGPDKDIAPVIEAVGFKPLYMGPIRYARNLEAIAELWIHCAIPPLGANYLGRDWSFAVVGNPEKDAA
jgi:predicted dinucleotide-binding enzyme